MGDALKRSMAFFAFVFLALQIFFWGRGDAHMFTLMFGMCLMCSGILAGWNLASKRKGGDKDAKNR